MSYLDTEITRNDFMDSVFNQRDDDFIVLANGNEPHFKEISTTKHDRTLKIFLPAGIKEIEIIGSTFGSFVSFLEPTLEIPPVPTPEPEPKKLGIASFVDKSKDPQSYLDRYNSEPTYKKMVP